MCLCLSAASIRCATAETFRLKAPGLTLQMDTEGGRYGFETDGRVVLPADATAGVLLNGNVVSFAKSTACVASSCVLDGVSTTGEHLQLTIVLTEHQVKFVAKPALAGADIRFQTGGAAPAYGLADHATGMERISKKPFDTDVTGFSDDMFRSGQGGPGEGDIRLVSNFVIYPKQQFAELLIDPTTKVVETSERHIVQGVRHATGSVSLFYFFGDPHQIYKAYLDARNAAGYRVLMPKYEAFGVGWEAFGALGWKTDQKTVIESIDRYLHEGYPLRWAVIGSGHWPTQPDSMHETTSFGFWDKDKYPDPSGMISHLKAEKLTVMLGLRITFLTTGPYSNEGVAKGYFLKDQGGQPDVFTGVWPKMPYYLLDAHNPDALNWYMNLAGKWQSYGISGWKEDYYDYARYNLRDDKVDPVNDRLMAEKQLVIERNGYLSSNGDLQRINDFNYTEDQDRGPVNALALAYSGFPFVYPDIVGGTFGEEKFSTERTQKMETYMQRYAVWAALHCSMGVGEPPWKFSSKTASIMLKSAQLHGRFAPYLYSNARRVVHDGFPWTMTPLSIAFPDDPQASGRENATARGYEWMIGDSVLAAPLYGNDYATANARDVYLPAGQWMDFDTGELYSGGQMLKGFALPVEKTPIFIGGSGITLEEHNGKIYVCIYPVARKAKAVLTLPLDERAINVNVVGLAAKQAWKGAVVTDDRGAVVSAIAIDHGIAFLPQAGHTYNVRALDQ